MDGSLPPRHAPGSLHYWPTRRPSWWILGAIVVGVGLGTFSVLCFALTLWIRFQ